MIRDELGRPVLHRGHVPTVYWSDPCCAALTPEDMAIVQRSPSSILPMLWQDRQDFRLMQRQVHEAAAFERYTGRRPGPMMRLVLWTTTGRMVRENFQP